MFDPLEHFLRQTAKEIQKKEKRKEELQKNSIINSKTISNENTHQLNS